MGRYIPIGAIERRKEHLKQRLPYESGMYPLFESYRNKNSYNFQNIRDSIYKWNYFSPHIGSNINKILELFDIVSVYGTEKELNEITNIINSYAVPYLESPTMFKKELYNRISRKPDQYITECLECIVEQINEEVECDRLINNYNAISKRFNIEKFINNNIIFEDAVTETIYSLCSLIDTYDMDLKSKFCIATEAALYSINKTIGNTIPQKTIVENIIDYYLINYGNTDVEKFIDNIQESMMKDRFIHETSCEYLEYLSNIHKRLCENKEDPDEIINKLRDESVYGLSEDMDQYAVLSNSLACIYELAIMDKAKAIITKLKMVPTKSISMVKEAIRALLVTSRVQDLAEGTKNSLSLVFYVFITIAAFSIGLLPGVLGFITSVLLHSHSQKSYLKNAIREWKEHKYSVTRKIKDTDDPQKRRRLEAYLDEVDKNISLLEREYEKTRDKTTSELNDEIDRRVNSPDFSAPSNAVNPIGREIMPSSLDVKKQDSHDTKQPNDNKSTDYSNHDNSIDSDIREYEQYMKEREMNKRR